MVFWPLSVLSHLTVATVTVYLGFYAFIVFLSLSVACGLYYLAELIEEFTNTTRRIISLVIKARTCHYFSGWPGTRCECAPSPSVPPTQGSLLASPPLPQAELVLHLLLLLDRLPLLCLAVGAASHLAYARLLRQLPYVQITSPEGLLATAAFAGSNVIWIRHYYPTFYTVEYVLAFMLVTTWLVPFAFFLSMAGENAVLPGAGGFPYSSPPPSEWEGRPDLHGAARWEADHSCTARAHPIRPINPTRPAGGSRGEPPKKKRRGLALRIFDVLRRKRDEALPDVLARMQPMKEKI